LPWRKVRSPDCRSDHCVNDVHLSPWSVSIKISAKNVDQSWIGFNTCQLTAELQMLRNLAGSGSQARSEFEYVEISGEIPLNEVDFRPLVLAG